MDENDNAEVCGTTQVRKKNRSFQRKVKKILLRLNISPHNKQNKKDDCPYYYVENLQQDQHVRPHNIDLPHTYLILQLKFHFKFQKNTKSTLYNDVQKRHFCNVIYHPSIYLSTFLSAHLIVSYYELFNLFCKYS